MRACAGTRAATGSRDGVAHAGHQVRGGKHMSLQLLAWSMSTSAWPASHATVSRDSTLMPAAERGAAAPLARVAERRAAPGSAAGAGCNLSGPWSFALIHGPRASTSGWKNWPFV